MYTWKKLETIILSSHVRDIKGSLKRGLRGELSLPSTTYWDIYREGRARLLSEGDSKRTMGDRFKLKEGKFQLDIRKKFHTEVIRHQNRLPREAVEFPSLGDAPNSNWNGRMQPGQISELDLTSKSTLLWAGPDDTKGPFWPEILHDSMIIL